MPSKRGRRTRAETAGLVREAAVRLLRRDGLQGFANSVRLDDALRLLHDEQGIRLTHGSVYGRIWSDQRDFQLDIVATALTRYDGAEIAAAIQSASEAAPAITLPETFARAVAVARVSRQWNLWLGAHTAVVSTPERDDDEHLALALAEARDAVETNVAQALVPVVGEAAESVAPGFVTLLVGASLSASGGDDDVWVGPALMAMQRIAAP